MRLCTFEVRTSLGRHLRVGTATDQGIVDLNFACAWHLAGKGEARPYALADVLVRDSMLEFLQGEETSLGFARATLEHLLQEMRSGSQPLGLNEETLVYPPEKVKLKAPLPRPASLRDFYAFEAHVRKGFEKRGEPMPQEWFEIPVCFITGRLKELIIRGGVNISPFEIDEVLMHMPGVEAAIAVGFDNDWYGDEVGALVKTKPGVEMGAEQVIAHCRKYLPFAKSPKVVLFGDDIPVTSTGKYQRTLCNDLFGAWKAVQFSDHANA